MCGRFALFSLPEPIVEYFSLRGSSPTFAPRYNITPGQAVAVVRAHSDGRQLDEVQWGLVPYWAKDPTIGRRLINARAETLTTKPAFREAVARRRCLIVASGFYEWQDRGEGPRQPFFVRPTEEPMFAFGGLWERWRTPEGQSLETCVIVTTEAAGALTAIHDRMPVLVARAHHAEWLDTQWSIPDTRGLAERMPKYAAWPVTRAVNDPRRDDASLIEPAGATV